MMGNKLFLGGGHVIEVHYVRFIKPNSSTKALYRYIYPKGKKKTTGTIERHVLEVITDRSTISLLKNFDWVVACVFKIPFGLSCIE